MKYQAKIILLLGLCGANSLSAMQDNDAKKDDVPTASATQQNGGDAVPAPSSGYRALGQELQALYARIRHTSRFLQRPLDNQYAKYLLRSHSKNDADKYDEASSRVYQMWANKVRAINEASYINILFKSYPKTCASLMTLMSGILLAGAGYGGYRLFQYYKEQQDQEETPTESPDNQVPVAGIITEQSSPVA
jgi:hypothetical protein